MKLAIRIAAIPAFGLVLLAAKGDDKNAQAILPQLSTSTERIVSTIPANGDVNPYGVAFVPNGFAKSGSLEPGDILVSNFNNSKNLQGTGTTIVKVAPTGEISVFFQGKAGLGLTTALGVLKRGFVLVGNLPTMDGTSNTVQQGSLLILNSAGAMVANLSDASLLDGPWDLAIHDEGSDPQVFVSNVLNGTVTRLDLSISGTAVTVSSSTRIASGYTHRFDPAALVIGPTGLAYDTDHDVLYVASTGDNKVFAIDHARAASKDAGMGRVVYTDDVHLHGPLGLALAPNGHLITANGDAVNAGGMQNELVEFTVGGQFVAQFQVDSGAAGGAFGLAFGRTGGEIRFAAVDDVQNTLDIWTLRGGNGGNDN
jgi:DNA-binding beta-propeller fold protein YncE